MTPATNSQEKKKKTCICIYREGVVKHISQNGKNGEFGSRLNGLFCTILKTLI